MPPRTPEKTASSPRRRGCFSGRPPRPPRLPGGGSNGSSSAHCASVIDEDGSNPQADGFGPDVAWVGHDKHEQTGETDIRAPGEAGRCRNHPPTRSSSHPPAATPQPPRARYEMPSQSRPDFVRGTATDFDEPREHDVNG